MSEEVNDEGHLREYLLGALPEREQQALEERLMVETELFDLVPVVEDELIDDYLGELLSSEERGKFESYFLSAPERRRKLRFASALLRYVTAEAGLAEEPPTERSLPRFIHPVTGHPLTGWSRAFSGPYSRTAAVVVIAIGAGLGIWRIFLYQSELSKGVAALARAYRGERPIEARISGLDYAPLSNIRGGEQTKVDEMSLNRAERILLDEVTERPTSAAHHALGRLYLAERKFEEAITQFYEALDTDPNNAQLHSDFGAALLEKGKVDRQTDDSGKGLEEVAKSLEHLNRALELDGSRLEAIYNRALVHQEMALPDQAEEEWHIYLERDPNSRWAVEARQKLKLLEEHRTKKSKSQEGLFDDFLGAYRARDGERAWQIISQSRDALSGRLISERLLDVYLEAAKGDDDNADNEFQALSYLAALEDQRANDTYTSGLAHFYRSSSTIKREKLAQARNIMKSAYELSARSKPLDAIEICSKAKDLFAGLGDEWEALRAQQWIGYCYLEAADTEQGITILEQLTRRFERNNYEWLLMRTFFLLSRGEYDRNEYSKAIDYDKRALALADRMGDRIGIFNALSMLTEQYRYIGSYREALSCAQRSMAMINSCPLNPIQLERHYGIMALAFGSFGHYPAAVDYQRETLRGALIASRFQHISAAYAHIGLMYGKLGNYPEALKNAELAYETARSMSDEPMRKKMMAYSSLQMGHLYRERGDISEAIEGYDRCIEFYTNLDFHYYVYEAHKNRLYCYLMAGNDSLAKEELQTTLSLAEKYRSKILEGENRNNFFDLEQSVYDLAIDFAYSRMNNARKAFEYSEGSRSRSLLDLISTSTHLSDKNGQMDIIFASVAHPLTLSEIQTRMPEQTQVIQYAVLSNKLITWIVSKTEFSTVERKIAQQELTDKVLNYVRLASSTNEGNGDRIRQTAEELFDILIGPAEPLLHKDRLLCVIPDKVLNYLPFAPLMSRNSGRFLLEDYLVEVAPSSNLLVACSEIAKTKEGARVERLLSVGNPRFDRRAFPSLPDLPSAGREAEEITNYYSPMLTSLLTGDNAREDRVKSEMPKCDVIHFALHALVDQQSPMRSKLLLTEEPNRNGDERGPDGVLEAQELYGLKLERTRVVVLSACQTGVGRFYNGEGMLNIARPFLANGVPLVVVSMWPVEDSDLLVELMVSFHKHRKGENLSTAEALRRAQLEMLNRPEERFQVPRCWAAFAAIGGSTSF